MTIEEYIPLALRTESPRKVLTIETNLLGLTDRTLHGIIGLVTEIGEIQEAYEKEEIDYINILEEIGDCYWYMAVLINDNNLEISDNSRYRTLKGFPTELHTMSASLLDLTKKTMYYGQEYKIQESNELITDIYLSLGDYYKSISKYKYNKVLQSHILETNINKLKVRFPDKFDIDKSNIRDLKKERSVLESICGL